MKELLMEVYFKIQSSSVHNWDFLKSDCFSCLKAVNSQLTYLSFIVFDSGTVQCMETAGFVRETSLTFHTHVVTQHKYSISSTIKM